MGKTVNRFDDLMRGLYPTLLKEFDSVELKVAADGETFTVDLSKGKKNATVALSHEDIAHFFAGDNAEEIVATISAEFKAVKK